MTREQIEKAARKYATDKHGGENTKQWAIAQIHAGRDGFIDGAKWRINSVWHNLPNDLPKKENTWILLELIFEDGLVYLPVEWVNDWEGAPKQAIRWAYIDDLLPERKRDG